MRPASSESWHRRVGRRLMPVSLFLFFVLLCTALWFRQRFGKVEVDQLLFHLQQGPDTVISADQGLVWSGIKNCLLGPVVYTAVLLVLARWASRRGHSFGRSLATLPAQVVGLAGMSMLGGYLVLSFPPGSVAGSDWIAALYRKPAGITAPAHRKNLILIYAESLEFSYGTHAFAGDLLRPLETGQFVRARSFPHFRQMSGTGWTIAGMVATQCGIPLKPLGVFGQNKLGQNVNQFLPQARCLGDVLKQTGYTNVFLGGASKQFGGKGMFLQTHGYDKVMGREDWRARYPDGALNAWGLNDDDLFNEALKELAGLSRRGKPFNLTILTVGMHEPDGFLAPSCARAFDDFRDDVACTAHLIGQFVENAQARGYLEDADVVVLGDHLSRPNSLYDKLENAAERSVYNKFLTTSRLPINRQEIDHFDVGATILSSLGYGLRNGQFGLGCSALGQVSCKSLVYDPLADAKLAHSSLFYNALWLPAEVPG